MQAQTHKTKQNNTKKERKNLFPVPCCSIGDTRKNIKSIRK